MRLLDTSTLKIIEFFGNAIPIYAILSHTWEEEEVSFYDLQNLKNQALGDIAGYAKIKRSCELARQYGYSYMWIDTCCIDKTSSAELSEAINSMYGYYRDSRVCFAYLADVFGMENPRQPGSAFRGSRWLLAPLSLVFFNHNWEDIGTKSSLKVVISEVTGIPIPVLLNNHSGTTSVATRMSWAAKRETTRAEDLAYCLMGIFDVNMPTLYGEGGPNAFMRLQQEIIKFSDDQSIFAWTAHKLEQRGLFAGTPSEFRHSGDIQVSEELEEEATSYAMTNRGLRIELPFVEYMGRKLAILRCRRKGALLGIYFHHEKGNQYARASPDQVVIWWGQYPAGKTEEVYVKERDASISKWNRPVSFEPRNLEIKLLSSLKGFTRFEMLGKATSSTRGVLLQRRQECFALLVGAQEHIWSYLVTGDARIHQLADMYHEKLLPAERIRRTWDELRNHAIHHRSELGDRMEKSLNSKETVFVAIREINEEVENSYKSRHVAEVGIREWDIQQNADDSYYVPPQYDFSVNWAQAYNISLKEVYPDNVHKRNKAAMLLISAEIQRDRPSTLVFNHQKTGEAFAVVLGLLNSVLWSDIFIIHTRETAESVSRRIKNRPQKSTSLVIAGNTIEVSAGRKECLGGGPDLWANVLEYGSLSGTTLDVEDKAQESPVGYTEIESIDVYDSDYSEYHDLAGTI